MVIRRFAASDRTQVLRLLTEAFRRPASPDPSWGDEFQVRALSAYDPAPRGALRYAPAFAAVGAG